MQCPKCGGECWDNRKTKKSPKQPDYRCKDKDNCDGVIWPPRDQQTNAPAQTKGNTPTGQKRPLAPLYFDCLTLADRAVLKVLPNATTTDIVAAAATLFIAATRDGTPLIAAPKPKPAPPPPPPVETDDYDQGQDGGSDDFLPF